MKRLFSLVLVALLLVPVLCVSVFASEADYYEFEYFPSVSEFSDSLDSNLDGSTSEGYASYLMEDLVPEGTYRILLLEGSNLYFDFGVFDIVYAPSDSTNFDLEWRAFGEVYSDFTITFALFSNSSFSVFTYTRWGNANFPDLDLPSSSIRLVPVGSSSAPDSSVSESEFSLDLFLASINSGLFDLNTSVLVSVITAALVICVPLALAWFGYRYLKRKVRDSIMKGKI